MERESKPQESQELSPRSVNDFHEWGRRLTHLNEFLAGQTEVDDYIKFIEQIGKFKFPDTAAERQSALDDYTAKEKTVLEDYKRQHGVVTMPKLVRVEKKGQTFIELEEQDLPLIEQESVEKLEAERDRLQRFLDERSGGGPGEKDLRTVKSDVIMQNIVMIKKAIADKKKGGESQEKG